MFENRTALAAVMILIYAAIVGFTDNLVRAIADEAGLWQFHTTRTLMAITLLALVAVPLGLRLRPVNLGAVVARSTIHGLAMVIYFGALGFLPVAVVAAGLFTAPIFVLLISHVIYGEAISASGVVAVIVGFGGTVMVLGPEAWSGASLPTLLPVVAGALYAMGNVATRKWCPEESAETLLAGFFVALGVIGVIGMAGLTLAPMVAVSGPEGFLTRGPVWPTQGFWFWTFVQAAGSLLAIGLMVRAYQIADATTVSVFEYVILPASALWSWAIWEEVLAPLSILGMGLIVAAGVTIATGVRRDG